jgi:hypothetical protein
LLNSLILLHIQIQNHNLIWQSCTSAGSYCAKNWATWLHGSTKQLQMPTTAVARSFLPLAVAVAPAISKLINYNSSQTYDEALGFVIASPCQLRHISKNSQRSALAPLPFF